MPSSKPITETSSILDLRLENIESSISNNHKTTTDALEQLSKSLGEIKAQLPKLTPPLEAFNRILEPEIAYQVQRKLEFLGAGKARKAVEVLQERGRNKKYESFKSFIEVVDALKIPQKKGSPRRLISEEKMLALIDRWDD